MKVLICSDGSEWAQNSARFTLQLFRDTAHELTVLTFKRDLKEDESLRTPQDEEDDEANGIHRTQAEIAGELRDIVEKARLEPEDVTWLEGHGDLAKETLERAGGYDLVCLGGAGRGGFSHNILGAIVNEVIQDGSGNLLVTKESDDECRRVLLPVKPEDLTNEVAHYLGRMFRNSPIKLSVHVLWSDLPGRFEGYLEAKTGQKFERLANQELLPHDQGEAQEIIEIIETYGVDSKLAYRSYKTVTELVDNVNPRTYDLIIVRPPEDDPHLIQRIEPAKQTLDLMRKCPANILLLRSLT